MSSFSNKASKDLYRILRVNNNASNQEIKTAYRKLALEFHPDKHDGCPVKTAKFVEVSEAYAILMNISSRQKYDSSAFKGRFSKNREFIKDYRKVYVTQPPPNWTMLWDHEKHYEMHYGDGFKNEAIKTIIREAQRDKSLEYRSPLGRGFSFSSGANQDESINVNPYSKNAPQGPPRIIIEYEEGEVSDSTKGKFHVRHREKIVKDMEALRNANRFQQNGINQQQSYDNASSNRLNGDRVHLSHRERIIEDIKAQHNIRQSQQHNVHQQQDYDADAVHEDAPLSRK